jgi:hypothetical protein
VPSPLRKEWQGLVFNSQIRGRAEQTSIVFVAVIREGAHFAAKCITTLAMPAPHSATGGLAMVDFYGARAGQRREGAARPAEALLKVLRH